VTATGSNKAWTTADDAVTLIAGTGKTLTARVVDTAGNVTALTLSGNGYTHRVVCTFSFGHCVVCTFSFGHRVVCTFSFGHCSNINNTKNMG
jgi:hypothetical protein